MILEEVDRNSYEQMVKPDVIFNSAKFNALNGYKVDRVRYLLFKDKKYRFALCVGQRRDMFLAPFSAPFASFESLRSRWELLQLDEAVQCFDEFAEHEKISTARFTLPPPIYDETLTACLQNILLREKYTVRYQDLNFSINLTDSDIEHYSERLPANARKNLRIALSSGLDFRICTDIDDKRRAYDIIEQNRNFKGYPLRMTWEQVRDTIAIIPHEFFIVSRDKQDIAAAIVFQVTDKIAQVIYWGDIPNVSEFKPVNYLAYRLIQHYSGRGFKYLDIGPSTEDGIPNYGLCDFKCSIGCRVHAKFSSERKFFEVAQIERVENSTLTHNTPPHFAKYYIVRDERGKIFVELYTDELMSAWNEFVDKAKNSHFFFNRNYMDYHRDRFEDHSLMFYDDKGKLLALLPANRNSDQLISHGGLTFGGFLVDDKMTVETMLDIFTATKLYLRECGFRSLIYKAMPIIYHKYPCEEDKYALFVNDAKLVRRDVSSTILLPSRYKYFKGRKWMVSRGRKFKVQVSLSTRYEEYSILLGDVLGKYHDAVPVHTWQEMQMLAERFPDNIKLYTGEIDNEILAGTIIFENGDTIHTQYLANSDAGRKIGALDRVIDYLISEVYADKKYFDFGISNENGGRYLNRGLISQKEGFGARAIVHDFYELTL